MHSFKTRWLRDLVTGKKGGGEIANRQKIWTYWIWDQIKGHFQIKQASFGYSNSSLWLWARVPKAACLFGTSALRNRPLEKDKTPKPPQMQMQKISKSSIEAWVTVLHWSFGPSATLCVSHRGVPNDLCACFVFLSILVLVPKDWVAWGMAPPVFQEPKGASPGQHSSLQLRLFWVLSGPQGSPGVDSIQHGALII